MTKRILAMFLAVVMVVGLLPMNVFAGSVENRATPHTHCICGDTACTKTDGIHKQVQFDIWGDDANEKGKLPTSGAYCLYEDMDLTAGAEISGELTLCLNGKTADLKGKNDTRLFALTSGDVLNITDCGSNGTLKGGKKTYGGAANVGRGSVLNLYAGKISGNTAPESEGGAFYVAGGNNTTKTGAIVNMYGGEISNNVARIGAAVRLTNPSGAGTRAQFNMYGGLITGNSISSTNATQYATIYADQGNVKLLGGEISGNTSTNRGAVAISPSANLTLGGNIKIQNNTVNGAAGNLFLVTYNNADAKFTVDNLTAEARIGVGQSSDALANVVSANDVDASLLGCFTADDSENLEPAIENGKLVLKAKVVVPPAPAHTHCICGDTACTKTDGIHKQVEFDIWGDDADEKGKLPTSGAYCLHESMDITEASEVSGELTLCLNGKTADLKGKSNTRLFALTSGDVLNITDCGTNGTLKGGNRTFGGAANVGRGSVLNLYAGKISGNTAPTNVSSGSEGGAFYVVGGDNTTKTGAIVNMYGGEISGNTAKIGAAVRLTNPSGDGTRAQFNMYGGKITGNTATQHAAIYADMGNIALRGGQITGNTSAARGAVAISSNAGLTLGGDIKIQDNTVNGAAGNLYLVGDAKFTVDGLADDAKIGLTGEITRTTGVVSANVVTEQDMAFFVADDAQKCVLSQQNGYVVLSIIPDHEHCICGDLNCTATGAEHQVVQFAFHEQADKLPTSGNICLQTNVTLTSAVEVSGKLKICLHGHSITVNNTNTRAFALGDGDVLSITDCEGTGKITGGSRTYGGAVNVGRGSVLNLFGGAITGNIAPDSEGGALYVAGGDNTTKTGAIVNMYGGEISGNGAQLGSAVRLTNPSGEGTKAQFNMYGGKITGNYSTGTSTSNYGAVTVDKAIVKLLGGEISGNTSANYGAVYVTAGTELTLGGDIKIQNNTVNGAAGNLYLVGDAKFTVDGLADDAKIGLTREIARTTGVVSANVVTEQDMAFFAADDAQKYVLSQQNGYVVLSVIPEHEHCICGDLNCTATGAEHQLVAFEKWDKAGLPSSGNYYLTKDVQLSDAKWLSNKTVNLCLCGHTIKAPVGKDDSRVLIMMDKAVLSITDCAENPGKITGGSYKTGGAIVVHKNGEFNLYNGIISGNTAKFASDEVKTYEVKDESGKVIYSCKYELNNGGAIWLQAGNNTQKAVFNMYGGQIGEEGNPNVALKGSAVYISPYSEFNMYGGKIAYNEAVSVDTHPGYCSDAANETEIVDQTGKGTIYVAARDSQGKPGGTFNMIGGTIENNKATWGSAVYAGQDSVVNIGAVKITGNEANQGAFYLSRSKVALTGTQITGNTGKNGSAMCLFSSEITMTDVKVENNHATDGYGAIHINQGTDPDPNDKKKTIPVTANITVKGATVIANNTTGENKTVQNVYLRKLNGETYLTVDGLTTGANIGVTMEKSRITANQLNVTENQVSAEQAAFLHSDSSDYQLEVVSDKARLTTGHDHTVCAAQTCTHGHEEITWTPWNNKEKLPASGNYYLAVDVQLKTVQYISAELNLCLNGHTVTAAKDSRLISVQTKVDDTGKVTSGKLNLTDCVGSGKLTGGSSTFGGAINVQSNAVLNIWGGNIVGNDAKEPKKDADGKIVLDAEGNVTYSYSEGGGIYIQGGKVETKKFEKNKYDGKTNTLSKETKTEIATLSGGIVNLYGGSISDNYANVGGGVRMAGPGATALGYTYEGEKFGKEDAHNYFKSQFNMYDGEITGNTSKAYAGAVAGGNTIILLAGGEISGNTSNSNGAVYVTDDTKLTLSGDIKIQNNVLQNGKVANLYLAGNAMATLDNLTETARVSITAAKFDRVILNIVGENKNYNKNIVSDSAYRKFEFTDKDVYMANSKEHVHCACAGVATSDCSHDKVVWTAWESKNSLPETAGYYYLVNDIKLNKAYNNIAADVKLCLNGYTVTAKEGVRLLGISNGGIYSIADCKGGGKLTGGNNNWGGAINVNAGGILNLYGGIITGNKSADAEPIPTNVNNMKGQGGAIYLQAGKTVDSVKLSGGILNMYGGTISGNEATLGGAIYASAGTKINIYGGTIADNQAVKSGGAIYAAGGIETIISNAKLQNNSAKSSGGAVYVTGANSGLTIKNSTFKDNATEGYAGGAVFAQSSGTKINIDGCTFSGSKAMAGGAVYAGGNTNLLVDNSIFTGNYAEQGAAIFEQRATVTVKKVVMDGNLIKENGGRAAGIYIKAGDVTLDGIVIKNSKGGSGTAITTGSDNVTVDGVTTTVYPTVNFISGEISGNKGASGVVLLQGKTVFTMSGGTITGNECDYAGGVYASTNSTFIMTGGKITGNTAKTNGGGIYALRSTVEIKGGTISNNKATKMGAGIFSSGAKLTMSSGTISGNKTDTGTGGGAIATGVATASGVKYPSTVKISGGSISGNYGRHGGAILLQGNSDTKLEISGGSITGNNAKVDGGALYLSTHTKTVITGGTISGNTSDSRAGAIFHNNSKGDYTGVKIFGNESKSSGGAVMINGATSVVNMKDTVLYDNKSGGSGGAICHQGKAHLNLENVELYNNYSPSSGGAIYVSTNTYLDTIGGNIHDNTAAKYGGAIYLSNNTYANMDGTTIEANISEGDGGGIYSRSTASTFKNMKFVGNKAIGTAGAFYGANTALQGVSGMIVKPEYKNGTVMENLEFTNNQSGAQAGALYVHKGQKIEAINCTFTGNSSVTEGSAAYVAGDFCFNGLTATGNTSGSNGYAIYLEDNLFDGHSYVQGLKEMGGDVIVKDNQGGDMFLGETTTISVIAGGMGEKTHINVTLASGVLTNKVFGAYNYEGGDLVYVITYGDRSLTEPEYDANLNASADEAEEGSADVLLYAGVGVFVLAVAAVAVLLILKKKKKTPANQAGE